MSITRYEVAELLDDIMDKLHDMDVKLDCEDEVIDLIAAATELLLPRRSN